jgi:hypothetical protein
MEKIEEALSIVDSNNTWFIAFKTTIKPPTDEEIHKSIENGLILKLYMNVLLIDNSGFIHTVLFNKEQEKYSINIYPGLIMMLYNNYIPMPLPNSLIDIVKQADNPSAIMNTLHLSSRMVYNKIEMDFDMFRSVIKNLQDRVAQLEQK